MLDDEKSSEGPEAKPIRRKRESEVCKQHWPDGWTGDRVSASCVHGNYTR